MTVECVINLTLVQFLFNMSGKSVNECCHRGIFKELIKGQLFSTFNYWIQYMHGRIKLLGFANTLSNKGLYEVPGKQSLPKLSSTFVSYDRF